LPAPCDPSGDVPRLATSVGSGPRRAATAAEAAGGPPCPGRPEGASLRDLDRLLAAAEVGPYRRHGPPGSVPILGLATHTADVRPGTLFACIPGTRCDGHAFAGAALRAGATALLVQRPLPQHAAFPQVEVPDVRAAVARLARAFYGHPDRRLHVLAVTGTNGKTTTAFMLQAAFAAARRPLGVLGTVSYHLGRRELPAGLTTPDAVALYRMLAELVEAGIGGVVLEASSHALDQQRLLGLEVDTAVFTNLTRDHLDYHGTFMAYLAAKRRLFAPRGGDKAHPALAVVSVDCAAGRLIAREARQHRQVVTFGLSVPADVCGRYRESADGRGTLWVQGLGARGEIPLPLPGRHNAANALAATAAAVANGLPLDLVAHAIHRMPPVPGRFEPVRAGQDFEVVVDFAHNPDGLRWALATARRRCPGTLWLVFGCKGGDTDRDKRRHMGRIAGRLADEVLLTTDDPYDEDPAAIAADVAEGLRAVGASYRVVLDRAQAVREAIFSARAGDLVLVAGRGHEAVQTVGGVAVPCDDRTLCRQALAERNRQQADAPLAAGAGPG
jgi:UDP-N-acetylmuramoyl-L-alanyl-D-glutamate--2,6-diaminopimelate ligase